jgi:outer membrane lipoprotein-sorting protein
MLSGVIVTMVLLLTDSPDPVQDAFDCYQKADAYQVVVKSSSGSRSSKPDIVRYYYQKPGYVRTEVIAPFGGAVLIYSPFTKKVKLWPFGYGSFPSFSLAPDNKLIRSQTGQRIDRSDLGALYQNVMTLQRRGKTTVIGTESIAGQTALRIHVEGTSGFSVEGVSQFELWLDVTTGFPLKVMSYKADNSLIEVVEMSEYQINPEFPVDFFKQ